MPVQLKRMYNANIPGAEIITSPSQQDTALYTTYSHVLDGEIKAIAANWCLIVRTWGDTPAALIVFPTLGQRHQHVA